MTRFRLSAPTRHAIFWLLVTGFHATSAAQQAIDCDRTCLGEMLDRYTEAFAARDPSRLPVAPTVRFTENGRALSLGEGAWRTAGETIDYRDDLLDPHAGGAARLTAFHENAGIAQLFIRLRVVERQIAEIETIVVRAGDVRWFAPDNLEGLSKVFASPIAAAKRQSREELIAAARAYFTAIETEGTPQFSQAPFAAGMNRIENGLQTTNVQDDAQSERHTWSASEQLERSAYAGTVIPDRRYPIVDTVSGSVLALVVFRFASGATVQAAEIFKVEDGQIAEIRAILRDLVNDADTGWPATPPIPRYLVRRAAGEVTVDGELTEPAWAAAAAVTLNFLWEEQTGERQPTFARLLYDERALYVGFQAVDADINARFTERDDPTFLDDAVEIFINPDRNQQTIYYGFEMNARGVIYDYLNLNSRTLFKRYDATNLEIGVSLDGTLNDRSDIDRQWTLELAIPWENFERLSPMPPAPGTIWKINLNRWDGVQPDRRMSIWSDPMNDESWPHVPARFGDLVFID